MGAVEALSTLDRPVRRLLELGNAWQDGADHSIHTTSYRTARQLPSSQVDELVKAYQQGATTKELAARFGLWRGTVGKHLKDRGVDTRAPVFAPEDVQAAAQLYQSGWTLGHIAAHYGIGAETVRSHLVAVGVPMRARGRRSRPGH